MKNYIHYSIDNERFIQEKEDATQLLMAAAKLICFSDCNGATVEKIVVNGREVAYAGWQPAMLYEFYDVKTGEVIFSHQFLSWDH